MAEDLIKYFGPWLLLIVALGSMVDIFQFSWILKRMWTRHKRKIREQIRRDVIAEEFDKRAGNR